MTSNSDRDDCFGLTWDGLEPSSNGAELRRVRLEQLGLILVPNAMMPTELIELVLVSSREVRDAFFTFMRTAGRSSLMDMYKHLKSVLPPSDKSDADVLEKEYPYLHNARTRARTTAPRLIGEYKLEDESRFEQRRSVRSYLSPGGVPVQDHGFRMVTLLKACDEFRRTLEKASCLQGKESGRVASCLGDVRGDDVWGNFYYLPDDLKADVGHLLLQILLLEWFAIATVIIPHHLKLAQIHYAEKTSYGYSPYTDLFWRLHAHLPRSVPDNGGYDETMFATLLYVQKHPDYCPRQHVHLRLYQIEFTRMWANKNVRTIIGNIVAALWEEVSRTTIKSVSDIRGVLTSLCYALTTDSAFMMGNPARARGEADELVYSQQQPPIPSDDAGTNLRIIDAVRIALHELRPCIYEGSAVIYEYSSVLDPREFCSIRQCILWYGVLDWFHISPLRPDTYPAGYLDILEAPAAVEESATDGASSIAVAMAQVGIANEDDSYNGDSYDDNYTDSDDDDEIIVNVVTRTESEALVNADGSIQQQVFRLNSSESVSDDEDPTPPSSPLYNPAREALIPDNDRFDSLLPQDDAGDMSSMLDALPNGAGVSNDAAVGNDAAMPVNEDQENLSVPDFPDEPPYDANSLDGPLPIIYYNMRPNQLTFTAHEMAALGYMRDREANFHGIGLYLFVRAGGEREVIELPPDLVDDRFRSGNPDGVITRNLALKAMENVYHGSGRSGAAHMDVISREQQEVLTEALHKTFRFAPPLRELPLAVANIGKQARLAILRSMHLQLGRVGFSLSQEEVTQFMTEFCRGGNTDDWLLMDGVAQYANFLETDIRLGILSDNQVPRLGHKYGSEEPPTPNTHYVWIYHDHTHRRVGNRTWTKTFRALEPVESVVGHGRETHYWLGIRQAAHRAWRI